MTDTPRTGLEFVDAGTTDIDQPVNNNALALDAVVGMNVVSATTTAEPTLTSPTDDGKVYILPSGKTGTNWAARTNGDIAQWYSGNWYFYTPWAGLRARAADSAIIYQFTTAWAVWASVFGQSILDDANASDARTTLGLADNTYTPTLTNVLNISSSTAGVAQYLRIGNCVTVSGRIDITPTAAGATVTQVGLSLPVASNFSTTSQAAGAATVAENPYIPALVTSDSTNDLAIITFYANSTASRAILYTYTYLVI